MQFLIEQVELWVKEPRRGIFFGGALRVCGGFEAEDEEREGRGCDEFKDG